MFDGRLLSGVTVLVAAVERGSFAKAAESLGLSPSGVSRAVARLESRLGVRLLDRTTRSLHLTDEGRRFYDEVLPHLDGIEGAANAASGAASEVRGRLRVNVDAYFSGVILGPHLGAFAARYPELELHVFTRDDIGDLVSDNMDLAVGFGPPAVSSQIARVLLNTRILTVAAPSYLDRAGRPRKPVDLGHHACIQYRDPMTGRPFDWEFHRGKKIVPVATKGTLVLTDVRTMLEACLAGAGIAQVMALGVQDLLQSGQLVELFPDWPDETFPLHAVYPSRRHPPAKVRAFLDFCVEITKE